MREVNTSVDARWQAIGAERLMYSSKWMDLYHVDVSLPDGQQIEHIAVRMRPVISSVVIKNSSVLMIWRHRFVPSAWGWELPGGIVDDGETPAEAAIREIEEETGWKVSAVEELVRFQPAAGFADIPTYVFRADGEVEGCSRPDTNEASRVEWIPTSKIRALIGNKKIINGNTLIGLSIANCF